MSLPQTSGRWQDVALAVCAQAGRFGEGDLAAVLAHQAAGKVIPARGSDEQTLQRSTLAWEGLGR